MSRKLSDLITAENIKIMYSVGMQVAELLKENTTDWKKKSTLSIAISSVALVLFGILVIYFIATHRITPLIIYLVCMTPILSFGLARYSKNMVKLSKEYEEYRAAIHILLQKITDLANITERGSVVAIGAGLSATQRDGKSLVDDTATLAEIKKLPEYAPACHYAEMMEAIGVALQALKNEGLDVAVLLAQLEVNDMANDGKILESLYSKSPLKQDNCDKKV